jgi:hypothetical protein
LTLEQATLETASQMAVAPLGHRHCRQATNQKASRQQLQPIKVQDCGKATNLQQQAKWQLRHKGINNKGGLFLWTASPSGLDQQGR